MPAIKIRIPYDDEHAYVGDSLSLEVKEKLSELLHSPPAEPAVLRMGVPAKTVSIWLAPDQLAALQTLSDTHNLQGPQHAAAAILHAQACAGHPVPAPQRTELPTTIDKMNQALGDQTRPAQERFYVQIRDALASDQTPHKVLFAEAATGIGKTRPFIAVAIDWHRKYADQHVAIACPSYNVILQTLAQWRRVAASIHLPDYQVLLGQQEFVSQQALERLLNEEPEIPGAEEASAWLRGKGPGTTDDPFGHRWLLRSLQAATKFTWTRDFDTRVSSDCSETDEGFIAYQQQFRDARDTPVIFCTHAMLAVDVRRLAYQATKKFNEENTATTSDENYQQWVTMTKDERRNAPLWTLRNEQIKHYLEGDAGKLPRIDLLIVDEAHLLEQSFANVFTSGASIASLSTALRALHSTAPRVVKQGDLDALRVIWLDITDVGKKIGTEKIDAQSHPRLLRAITEVRELLGAIVKRIPKSLTATTEVRHIKSIAIALDLAAKTVEDRNGMRTRISWSPQRLYPSIEVGRYDVSRELDFLWAVSVRQKSVLVSATLFEDVSMAGLEGMRRTLSVRASLAMPLDPVRPHWLTDPVTLFTVSSPANDADHSRFLRPTAREKLSAEEFEQHNTVWREQVADYIASTWSTAAGGVLVLLTAHADREAIASRLADKIQTDAIVGGGEAISIEAARAQFIELTVKGIRPCLLAVGNAWTGLDISGDVLGHAMGRQIPPEDDNVLTDLIIPTAPIGLNRSLTHEWRRERVGMIAEISASSILFRQGIGRLVRREGLPHNRRLHFLDARIHRVEWNAVLAPIKKALSKYRTALSRQDTPPSRARPSPGL